MSGLTRRDLLGGTAAAATLGLLNASTTAAAAEKSASEKSAGGFRFCLNTSCLRGQKLDLVTEIAIAAEAGYTGIEPWLGEIQKYQEAGGTLADLRKRLDDAGLRVESAIGFAQWIVDDPAQRQAGLETLRRDLDTIAALGGTRMAAPPAGATKEPGLDLRAAGERYAAALAVGRQAGVLPMLEVWGFSANLSRLSEVIFVALESGQPDACLLPDVYHLYKGGSAFGGLAILAGSAIPVFHMNDYPAEPPRATIADKDRVHCGDGVAPLTEILTILRSIGFSGALSLELFNPTYWQQDPRQVARTGLQKMQAAVAKLG